MFKKFAIFLVLPTALLVAGCSDKSEQSSKGNHEMSAQEDKGTVKHSNQQASEDMQKMFAMKPDNINKKAAQNLEVSSTKNVTRIDSDELSDAAVRVSQTIWPATHKESQPGTVILAPEDNWQISMAAADLIHHPNNGPMLFMNDGKISEATLQEIERLQPVGNADGTQVMIIGDSSNAALDQLNDYKVEQIKGAAPAEFAASIDQKYAEVAGKVPNSVIIASGEERDKLYSLPAINWIAHMEEPVLYAEKDMIPDATMEALTKRDKKEMHIYLLGPEKVISSEVEKQLGKFGKVTRIAAEDPVSNAIAFATFKDKETGFGWGLADQPGHGISFISNDSPELALAAAPFSHLGKHAPLIWLNNGEPEQPLYDFLAKIRPTFTDSPQAGPYNHGFITGSDHLVPFRTQGILDEKLEITSADGNGHGGH